MKLVRFIGGSRDELSAFPKSARIRAGHELFMVQVGRNPDDWKKKTRKTSRTDLELARRRYRTARDLAE